MQCQFQHMSEVVALETDERSGTYSLGTWQEILLAMEANEIVDMEVKGHVLKRIMPQAGDESTGHWEISPKPGVALYCRWPVHNANVWFFFFFCSTPAAFSSFMQACRRQQLCCAFICSRLVLVSGMHFWQQIFSAASTSALSGGSCTTRLRGRLWSDVCNGTFHVTCS